jgi:hypothetical protein
MPTEIEWTLDINWVAKMREIIKPDSDEDVGRAGDTPTSRLADEIANRCGSNPLEAMRVIEALFSVTREVAEQPENRLLASGRLSFLSQYVLPPGSLINLAVPPKKK